MRTGPCGTFSRPTRCADGRNAACADIGSRWGSPDIPFRNRLTIAYPPSPVEFLTTHPGSVDDETGMYADAGLDFGGAAKDSVRFFTEIMWRKVDTSISFNSFDNDVKLDGFSLSAGATWRWGK